MPSREGEPQNPGYQAPIREYLPEDSGAPDDIFTVAVLGGNSIVGRALEPLLKGAVYDVRHIGQPVDGELGVLLEGANLLLLAPMLDSETLKKITDEIEAKAALAALPVLALMTSPAEHPHEGDRARHVP